MESKIAPQEADRPLVIPLFIPQLGCLHQCVFCNQHAITGSSTSQIPTPDQIRAEVTRYLRFARKRYSTIQISFFGGNFLGLDPKVVINLLGAAADCVDQGTVDSLRFSTRPDTVGPASLAAIAPFPVQTVELGVQSMNDSVLGACRRGHTATDTIAAATLLKEKEYQLGLQMMVGLPGDDDDGAMATARRMARLNPDFVRIYPTLVLNGSPLARKFHAGTYRPMRLNACIALVARIYLFFKKRGIPVARMGLQASDGLADPGALIAGPYHPALGHLVHGEIVLNTIRGALAEMDSIPDPLTIRVHPIMVSRVQGLNKRNLHHLQTHYNLKKIILVQDEEIGLNQLMVGNRSIAVE